MRDLRTWLKQVEELGELQVITQEMDSCEETSALNFMVGQQEGSPALLLENIQNAPPGFRALYNLFGTSKERVAAALAAQVPSGALYTKYIIVVDEDLAP